MAPIASADHDDRPPQHPKDMSNDSELEDTIIKCLVQHSAQRTMRGSGLAAQGIAMGRPDAQRREAGRHRASRSLAPTDG